MRETLEPETSLARGGGWYWAGSVAVLLVAAACNRADTKVPTGSTPAAGQTNTAAASPPAAASPASTSDAGTLPVVETPTPGIAATPDAAPSSASPTAEKSASSDADGKAKSGDDAREILFAGWPTPKFALVMTGQQIGYLESCGCTGLIHQKGGLSRRHTLIRKLTEQGWPLVNVDVGNQVHRFGRQAEIKFQITAEGLKKMGYQAIALGVDDLRQTVGELAAVTLANEGGTSPFVSANAAVLDRSLTPTHQILEVAGRRIGITAILGQELQSKIVGGEILLTSPHEGLDAVLPKLTAAKCDLLVLLAHASLVESKELAQKYPAFQVIVTSGGAGEPQFQPETIPGTQSVLVEVGVKGMFVGVLGFFDDPQTPWRYQRVPLDARFSDSRDMLNLLASYQEQLKSLGLKGLGVTALPHPTGRAFVGSEKCGECHATAYEIWQKTGHAHATETLIHPPERSEVARNFDPECLSCHVTGWDPQKFFPYQTGYLSLEQTPLLTGSGCENCHGPGAPHVAAESADTATDEQKLALRAAMQLPLARAEKKCLECHDVDNSPDFHAAGAFEKYWKKVEHKGTD